MSEIMRPITFPGLISRVKGEYNNHGSVFGIRKEKFFRPASGENGNGVSGLELFGTRVASPLGPAAGPHSQLAQNILTAYLAGARFIELKTVQPMDGEELRKAVARPCINSTDECYNVEWSTELTVAEAQEEYIKAWFLCHIFAKEFDIAEKCDFIFNMSVGYSLEGIKSAKIDSYIEGLKNARNTDVWKRCYEYIAANVAGSGTAAAFKRFTKKDLDDVSPVVSNSITLSTLHGCPREEIEKIAAYLLTEKGMHTYIKCNPTLLGYETARRLLDEMGYNYVSFDDHHFKNDLQFNDAVDMLRRLKAFAAERKLGFGVKITNTFPVQIKKSELPGEEMYMSGRALFPLSINVAKRLSDAFSGELPISYSGGADFFNLREILETGIRPVTLATTILKPGGYERLAQLSELAEKTIAGTNGASAPGGVIDVKAISALVESLPGRKRYRKEYRQTGSVKPNSSFLIPHSSLPLFNCFKAPCREDDCPIHQNIPEYLAAVAAGKYSEAFGIIARDNTAPSITGTICDHRCQHNCTRLDYEDPLQIRQAKLCAAENAEEEFTASITPVKIKTEKSSAIIGAGPAGIAAAVFLRRNGVPVTVYEKRDRPFGIVQHVIPSFRISDEAIFRDFQMAVKLGVEFVFNTTVSSISEQQKKHPFIVIATGAWTEENPFPTSNSPLPASYSPLPAPHFIDALRFLEDSKKSKCSLDLGKKVAVLGGGDVAMDCARAAKRNRGVESVAIVYRRTREFMPSQHEEQDLALAEGVLFMELLAPESYTSGILVCKVMRLGAYDDSGRRSIEETGKISELPFDTVIGAVGARVDTKQFTENGIALNRKGLPEVNASGETSLPGVYVAGDCKAGAATVVKAIAGGKAAAADILRKIGLEVDFSPEADGPVYELSPQPDINDLYFKKGVISEAKKDSTDAYRCLSCNSLCEICVDVCPNRANTMIELQGQEGFHKETGLLRESGFPGKTHQIVHIDRMCNECGNCAVFCPHTGKPYKDKFTIFSNKEDFADSENPGFIKTGPDTYKIRMEDKSTKDYNRGDGNIPKTWISMLDTIETKYGYLLS